MLPVMASDQAVRAKYAEVETTRYEYKRDKNKNQMSTQEIDDVLYGYIVVRANLVRKIAVPENKFNISKENLKLTLVHQIQNLRRSNQELQPFSLLTICVIKTYCLVQSELSKKKK